MRIEVDSVVVTIKHAQKKHCENNFLPKTLPPPMLFTHLNR